MGDLIVIEIDMKPDVRVFPDVDELSLRAAEAAVKTMNRAVRSTGRCSLVLSGGSTPRTLYGLLASRFREQIPWAHVHVFWGDERYVPADDARSNYRMARETLLDRVPCPAAHVHPMPTHGSDADAAARDYEATLRGYFGQSPPDFDLVFLGLGPEGHTASLFPQSPALTEPTRWVLAVAAPADPPRRLTLTLPLLNRAANAWFLVTGSNKAHALHHILSGIGDPNLFPAAGVRLASGTLIWWVDRDAAIREGDPDVRGDNLISASWRSDDRSMDMAKTKKIFTTIPVGTNVTWHYRSAIGHGAVVGVRKMGTTADNTMYNVRQHDDHPGEPAIVHHTGKALSKA